MATRIERVSVIPTTIDSLPLHLDTFEGLVVLRDSYLSHDVAYVVNALGDRLAAPGDSDSALRRVRQHLARHLDRGPRDLPDLLYLRAALPDKGTTLGGGHHQSEGDRRSGDVGGQSCIEVLLEFLTDQRECLVDGLAAAYNRDYALGTRAVSDVNFCPTLQWK